MKNILKMINLFLANQLNLTKKNCHIINKLFVMNHQNQAFLNNIHYLIIFI